MINSSEILKNLIRFDTTNPPGNEKGCILYLKKVCDDAGIETQLIAKDPERPNLIATLRGDGSAPPLLLQGHVDVVSTEGQNWTHPPFEAVEQDSFIWGRGALDMKSGVTMMVASLLKLKASGQVPKADIIFCAMSDEENGSEVGAKFLVEEHAELFSGVKHALGEFGGFSTYLGGQKFYLIQVAEKLACSMRLTFAGPAGHGSQPIRGSAVVKLARAVSRLERTQPPIHINTTTKQMIESMAEATTGATSTALQLLLRPYLTDILLKALHKQLGLLNPMFRNTVSATIVKAGSAINVIPAEVTLELDGRMLPGFSPEQIVQEVQKIVGKDVHIEVTHHDKPAPAKADMSQFEMLADILKNLDPEAIPIPYLLPGVTDGRFFSELGIQTYGFTPMNLPEDFNFSQTIHAADERIPVSSLEFGVEAMYKAILRYEG